MSWVNRNIIAALAPQWALKRARSQAMVKAFYDATEYNRYRANKSKRGSADQHNERAQRPLLEQARYLDENYDIFSGALDALVNNVVGVGLVPEFHVKDIAGNLAEEVNEKLTQYFEDWARHPEVTGEHDYNSLQRLACRAWFRDGESFAQYLSGAIPSLKHNTIVPYSIEQIESELCPIDYTDESKKIKQGIRKNDWGRPTNFYFYKGHPNETYQGSIFTDLKTLEAERVQHLKLTKRFRQTRGISIVATVNTRFDDIKDIEESERVAARVAAAVTGSIKKGMPEMWNPYVDEDNNTEEREMEFAPGMILDTLGPGESLEIAASNRPNNQIIMFRDANIRAAASGLMATYSSIAKDYNGTYSSQRQELVEGYGNYAALSGYFASRKVIPDIMRFMQTCYDSGLVKIGADIDKLTLFSVDIVPPQMPWIDPKKEADAWTTMLDYDLESRAHISRKRGRNPQKIIDQIRREQGWPANQISGNASVEVIEKTDEGEDE